MDFRFSNEQDMIAEMIGSVLRDKCTTTHLRKMVGSGQTQDAERWGALAGLGICGVLVPEAFGGMGLSEVEFVRIAETCGAFLLPEPLVESSGVALPLLAELSALEPGVQAVVASLAAGDGFAVVFHPEVPYAAHADTAHVIVRGDEAGNLFQGRPNEMALVAQPGADPLTPLFSCSGGSPMAVSSEKAGQMLSRARDRGALFVAAQMAGIAQSALDMTVEYAKGRQQFGRPIGANQAVKHLLAEVQVAIEFLRPVLYAAAAMLARGDAHASAHVSHARLRAAETVQLATERAVQVHGAMGYSWEADVHLFLKRGLMLSRQWGSTDEHLDRVEARAAIHTALNPDRLF